jgi:hypothetical protein
VNRNFVPAPWAHLCVSSTVQQSVAVPGDVCPAAACISPGRICSTAACAVPEDGLQQLVVHLDCLSTRASAAPRRVCLQELLCAPEVSVKYIEPVLYLCVSAFKSFCVHLRCLSTI